LQKNKLSSNRVRKMLYQNKEEEEEEEEKRIIF
jgi:hypothetical protein